MTRQQPASDSNKGHAATDDSGDAVWLALSDPTRRSILDLLRNGPMTTGELSGCFESTRFAVMKHLKVLVSAQLVVVEKRGRERLNHLNPLPLQALYRRWIRPFDQLPADRLLRLKQLAQRLPKE